MSDIHHILKIDASARQSGSVSRQLSRKVVDHFAERGGVQVTERNLNAAMPFVTEDWIGANFTKPDDRNPQQKEILSVSDNLVSELEQADTIIIGTPIYNFSIPASLKAWVDMVARVGRTFRYTENGPLGLLTGKRAIIVVVSGGTKVGSDIDFATPYLRHALKFIGITDVTFFAADALGQDAETKMAQALETIKNLN